MAKVRAACSCDGLQGPRASLPGRCRQHTVRSPPTVRCSLSLEILVALVTTPAHGLSHGGCTPPRLGSRAAVSLRPSTGLVRWRCVAATSPRAEEKSEISPEITMCTPKKQYLLPYDNHKNRHHHHHHQSFIALSQPPEPRVGQSTLRCPTCAVPLPSPPHSPRRLVSWVPVHRRERRHAPRRASTDGCRSFASTRRCWWAT